MFWHRVYSLEEVNTIFSRNMTGFLGIRAIEIGEEKLVAEMEVSDKVKQPFGILHGGASVVLAESVGSIASNMVLGLGECVGVGLEVNANHLRSVSSGKVLATCQPLHIGKKTHVWDIKIRDEQSNLVCVSRLTVAIVPNKI